VAVNCWVAPTARLAGDDGVTAIEVSVGLADTTVKVTAVLVNPDNAAVIPVLPGATPVALPLSEIVAMLVIELAQLA
jgi:hypothetical protein